MTWWTEDAKLGWQVFCAVLSFARDERLSRSSQSRRQRRKNNETRNRIDDFKEYVEYSDDEMDIDQPSDAEETDSEADPDDYEPCQHFKPEHNNFYGRSRINGMLWVAIQTELLFYRRLEEGDERMSKIFDMLFMSHGLKSGGIIPIPLVENDMMSPTANVADLSKWTMRHVFVLLKLAPITSATWRIRSGPPLSYPPWMELKCGMSFDFLKAVFFCRFGFSRGQAVSGGRTC